MNNPPLRIIPSSPIDISHTQRPDQTIHGFRFRPKDPKKAKKMPLVINREQIWPAVQNIYIFSMDTSYHLFCKGLIEEAGDSNGEGAIYLKIHNQRYFIPKVATSRLALFFIGFTPEAVELIWAWVHNPRSATCMVTTKIPNRATEFWNRVGFWVTNQIQNVMKTMYLIPEISAHELLNSIGFRNDAQLHKYTLNSSPELGGLQTFCLCDVIESDVLFWAGRVILRRWNMLVTFESTVCTEGNEFDESGWAEVVKEFTQSPIDASMPYSSDSAFLLPGEILRLNFRRNVQQFGQLPGNNSKYRFDY